MIIGEKNSVEFGGELKQYNLNFNNKFESITNPVGEFIPEQIFKMKASEYKTGVFINFTNNLFNKFSNFGV